jgi:DNA polymerase
MDPYKGILGVDIETASAVDLKDYGAWAYSQHPSTRVYCVVFAYSTEGRVWAGTTEPSYQYSVWEPESNAPLPPQIASYVAAGGGVLAHNAGFERAVWANLLLGAGFPPVGLDQWQDTQALGLSLNLPVTLGGLARALGCPIQKDEEGAKLMRRMAVAEPDGRDGWRYPLDTPANRTRLRAYCCRDVGAMLNCYWRMPSLSVTEACVWRVDQKVNARGVYLDQAFASRCSKVAATRKTELNGEAFGITAGELANSTAVPSLKAWLAKSGVELPKVVRKHTSKASGEVTYAKTETVDATTVRHLLEDPALAAEVRAVLLNRQEASKATSLAKLDRVARMVGADGRLRNALQYCGASTGRWTSHGFQVHNLRKDAMGPGEGSLVRLAIQRSDLDLLKLAHDRPLDAVSQSLRSVIVAPEGRDLVGGDFSAIEARVIAWLAGQDDVLGLFRDGVDVYAHDAAAFGSRNRDLGKVARLALGFGMGVLKLSDTGADKGIYLELLEWRRIQQAWRNDNYDITQFWYELEDAARKAIEDWGSDFYVGKIKVYGSEQCLFLRLPSGRSLRYWRPRVVACVKTFKVVEDDGTIVEREVRTDEVRFYSVGKNKRDMVPEGTYGGKLAENVTQAVARDLLAEAMVRVEAVDPYEVVMHAHDSIAAEVPSGAGDVGEFCGIMSALPAWADGLPVKVDGYRGRRFRG